MTKDEIINGVKQARVVVVFDGHPCHVGNMTYDQLLDEREKRIERDKRFGGLCGVERDHYGNIVGTPEDINIKIMDGIIKVVRQATWHRVRPSDAEYMFLCQLLSYDRGGEIYAGYIITNGRRSDIAVAFKY